VRANYQTAGELAAQLLEVAELEPQAPYLPEAHRCMGHNLLYLGKFELARTHLEQEPLPEDIAEERELAVLYGQDPILSLRSAEAYCLWFLGYPDQARARSVESLCRARELGHPFSLAFALCFAAHVHHVRRQADITDRWAEERVALASEQGFSYLPALGVVYRGFALAERGEHEAGILQMREGLTTQQAKGAMMARSRQLGMLAEALGRAGQCERGLEVLEEAQAFSTGSGEVYFAAELLRLRGELLLQHDQAANLASAEAAFLQAIEVARDQRARSWELRAGISLGRLWADGGERTRARALLGPIYDWFTEGFDTPDLQDARTLLEALA
jgi:predicted ATPase